ncbi:MAG TPA: NnrS family protein [Burkholderiales bacterium]|nr:NnrS family protein [Burkholderiales bacterium]HEX2650145.1 NnrS family protein [Burkholderiales bacterium]
MTQASIENRPSALILSAGFRPFFLLAAAWAAVAVPVWLAAFVHGYVLEGSLPALYWHGHEMVFGYGLAALAGFLLTAIPNWTGRLPVRGARLAVLAGLWIAGRFGLLASASIGATAAAVLDLSFSAMLIAVVAREVTAARNFHNFPVVVILTAFFAGNLLVHLQALALADTAELGLRIGVAMLLLLIALIGGRIVPSFTRNWLAKERPAVRAPAPHSALDWACLGIAAAGVVAWAAAPDATASLLLEIGAGVALALRLARWRGLATFRNPLLFVLHVGYAWLAFGLALAGLNGFYAWLPSGAPLHALTVGAIGTMTVAVMTRATLGHSGRPLAAGPGTIALYLLVFLAALLRLLAPLSGHYAALISLSGFAWSAGFAIFLFVYTPLLLGKKS